LYNISYHEIIVKCVAAHSVAVLGYTFRGEGSGVAIIAAWGAQTYIDTVNHP